MRLLFRMLISCTCFIYSLSIEVRGEENIPKKGNFIVASKHYSDYEIIVIADWFFQNTTCIPTFLSRKFSLKSPPFAMFYIYFSPVVAIFIENIRSIIPEVRKVFTSSKYADRAGLVVFPEGQRVQLGEKVKYNISSIYFIYKKMQVPVVPLALNFGIFSRTLASANKNYKCKLILEFGPCMPNDLEKQDFCTEIEGYIQQRSEELVEEAQGQGVMDSR